MTQILTGLKKDLDGFSVTRILPHMEKKMVGPFIFIDHMGPAQFAPGEGIDVRPHPHIGLATITYLFEGAILHRDSLGNNLEIVPGDVNWMTAGKGIVHSERETLEVKAHSHGLDGLQCWVALPKVKAEIEPSFHHIKKAELPHFMQDGVLMRLIVGDAYGKSARIKTYSDMFYLDVLAKAGRTVSRPDADRWQTSECAVYVCSGEISIKGERHIKGDFVLLKEEEDIEVETNSRFILLGGEHWSETPHIYWNFVSFSKDRIEKAKDDWKHQRFPSIPGDDDEFTPLPDKAKKR